MRGTPHFRREARQHLANTQGGRPTHLSRIGPAVQHVVVQLEPSAVEAERVDDLAAGLEAIHCLIGDRQVLLQDVADLAQEDGFRV